MVSNMRLTFALSCIGLFLTLVNCNQDQKRSHSGGEREVKQERNQGYKPGSSGQPFEVMVIGDKIQDRTDLKKMIDSAFKKVYPALPQPEPWFITNYVNAENFTKIHRRHKSLLFVSSLKDDDRTNALVANKMFSQKALQQIADQRELSIDQKKDVYARPQTAAFLSAPSRKDLKQGLLDKRNTLIRIFDRQETRTMKEKLYSAGKGQITLNKQLRDGMDFYFKVPVGYKKAELIGKNETSKKLKEAKIDAFAWFRLDTDNSIQNVMAYTRSFEDKRMLEREYVKKARNQVTKAFVDGPADGSFMQIEDRYELETSNERINGLKAKEYRGLWRMEGAQMGGPFIHYAIHDPANDRVIYLDGFVYAAGERKKPFAKRVETILQTTRIAE